jgi:hypothetical protein
MQGGLEHERPERARNTRKPFVAFRVFRHANHPLALHVVCWPWHKIAW